MKRLFLLSIVMLISLAAKAQTSDIQQSSLIVALDVRSQVGEIMSKSDIYTTNYSSKITEVLHRYSINPDYVSGVLYGKKDGAKTPADYSKLIIQPSNEIGSYRHLLKTLCNNIPEGVYYSLPSLARPYSLMALKDSKCTNRTFLITLTDGKFNGNDDYFGEVDYMKAGFSQTGMDQFKNDMLSVQTNYFCQFKEKIPITGGYLHLYEFIPLQQYFSLESVLDFPHEIEAVRRKTNYQITFSSHAVANADYEIKRLQISLISGDKVLEAYDFNPSETVRFDVEKDEVDAAHLEIKAWVRVCDGVYNNTVLHPMGSKYQGALGLTRYVNVKKEGNAKIWNKFELSDKMFKWSFWTESQKAAATGWGWILALVSLFIILTVTIIVIYRSNIYKVEEGTTNI